MNDLRNSLAHRLDFKISFSEIDTIGFNLGREYVIKKFSNESESVRSLLLYVIDEISTSVFFPVFDEILKEKHQKTLKVNPSVPVSAGTLPVIAENAKS